MKTETLPFSPATLKSLSIRQCIKLARFLYPNYTWHYFNPYPDDEWDGHDVVCNPPVNGRNNHFATLSIDYREDVTTEQPRIIFKLWDGTREIPDQALVISFLTSIGKI